MAFWLTAEDPLQMGGFWKSRAMAPASASRMVSARKADGIPGPSQILLLMTPVVIVICYYCQISFSSMKIIFHFICLTYCFNLFMKNFRWVIFKYLFAPTEL